MPPETDLGEDEHLVSPGMKLLEQPVEHLHLSALADLTASRGARAGVGECADSKIQDDTIPLNED